MWGSGGVPACITPAIVLRLAGARIMRTAGFNPLCHAPVTEEISKLMRTVTGDFPGWITRVLRFMAGRCIRFRRAHVTQREQTEDQTCAPTTAAGNRPP